MSNATGVFPVFSRLECHLFPAKAEPGAEFLEINNATFSHWRKIWQDLLELKDGGSLPSDNFLRQDLICAITRETEVIGMIAASSFNLGQLAFEHHSYLKPFLESPSAASLRGRAIMSIEYLSVDARFRKNELGFSLGSVLLALSMKLFGESAAEAVLGTARSKIHVDEMCYKFGFTPCGEMDKFGHPCTLIVNTKEQLRGHDDLLIRRATEHLWQNRRDYFRAIPKLKLVA